jgi:hypothetical protein
MVHTLRITSVAAVVLAGVVIASIALPAWKFGFAGRDDGQVVEILNAPSAVDRFKNIYGDKTDGDEDTTPPLVKQAQVLAGILNPPAPKPVQAPPATRRTYTPPPRPLAPTTAKFSLVGTSYSQKNPSISFAYIRMPDQSYQWVRQGDEIGHTVIKEIRNGSIVCWDGQQDTEMVAEETVDTSSVLETGARAATTTASGALSPAAAAGARPVPPSTIRAPRPAMPATSRSAAPPSTLTEGDQQAFDEIVSQLRESDMDDASKAAAMSKLIEKFKARQSEAEAGQTATTGSDEDMHGDREERESALERRRREFLKRMSAARSDDH